MQSDDVVWHVINNTFCSFKAKIESNTLCRNVYNVSGLCNRSSCPLANGQYATVLEKDGVCYLYMKTVERAHLPNQLWERVKLSKNYIQALQQLDDLLEYWPKFLLHKCKQRLTKIRQYLIRMRKLRKVASRKIVTVPRKAEKIENIRQKKAELAAQIDNKIKQEILNRLKKGIYNENDIINFSAHFEEVLDAEAELEAQRTQKEGETEQEEGEEEVEQEEEEGEDDDQDEEEDEDEDVSNEREIVEEFVEDLSDVEDYEFENEGESGGNEELMVGTKRSYTGRKPNLNDDDDEDDDEDDGDEDDDEVVIKGNNNSNNNNNSKRPKQSNLPTNRKRNAHVRIEYENEMETEGGLLTNIPAVSTGRQRR